MQLIEFPYNKKLEVVQHCDQCGKTLKRDRAVANTRSGIKFFCVADPEQPLESCFLKWIANHRR
ncbi:hypothetical protein [Rhodopseudomonas palustris]|uniref:hypothetical protein n=1 Tax=Rhodopseudomonas palustris TaxID=1076 RepID=UPI000D19B897|nr:hypothetical protein [Rhodopseudomonas palustris]AVT83638.1 hypothetical protein RPYSC3_47780 [Rhodopseudomonas palustris]